MQRISPVEYFGNLPTQNYQQPVNTLQTELGPYKPFIIIAVVSGLLALGISIALLVRKCE